jgi:MFS family permease
VQSSGGDAQRGWRARLRGVAVDISPLRTSRDFRLLWTGLLISETGSQITLVALYIQVYRLTHSVAAVGAIGIVQLVPLVGSSLFTGPIIDRHDRRRLLLVSQFGAATASLLLLVCAWWGHPPLALVYLGAGLVAGWSGFALSNRSAMAPNLVTAEQLSPALALNQAMWNTSFVVGPLVGGLVIDRVGLTWAYGIDFVSFVATIVAAVMMRPMPPRRETASATGVKSVVDGFRFLRGRRVLQTTFIVDLIAMIFGMPRALFPTLAAARFHGGAGLVGLLFAAVSAGAIVGALTTGWVTRVERQGRAVLIAVFVWGAAITAFGYSGSVLVLALGCLALAGAADVISAVFRSTILQMTVPDDLRGRMSAVHILVVSGGPRLGDFEAGLVAAATSPTISVVSGGLACIVGVVALAIAVPEFARYRHGDAPPPPTVRT